MKMVTLASGEKVPAATFVSVKVSLRSLDVVELYEIRELARNPRHELWTENVSKRLHDIGLLKNGEMHDDVRAVILDQVKD